MTGTHVEQDVSVDPGLRTGVLDHVWRVALSNRGKEMRARVLISAEAAARRGQGVPDSRVFIGTAAIQMTHLATLAHDDVMDDSDYRRGLPSLQASFGAPLAGAAGAVFLGRALGLLSRCGGEAVTVASETALDICKGQMCELRSLNDVNRTPEQYLECIAGKTGAGFRLAAVLGAIFGGARPNIREALQGYGEALGVAHQIIDDVLDITGDPQRTGKKLGNDLRNGNFTLPIIFALEERPGLVKLLRENNVVGPAIEAICETEAIDRAGHQARLWIAKAKEAVADLAEQLALLEIADEDLGALDRVSP